MAKCDYCGTSIFFGGVTDGNLRFCNNDCHQNGSLLHIANQVPMETLAEHMVEVHHGQCPQCGGPGPIDVHTSHTVWSMLVMTSWNSKPQICCRSCGVKAQLGGIALSGLLGWWGFPWGIIMTPIQIMRNFGGLISPPASDIPSPELQKIVKLHLAAHLVEAHQRENPPSQ